MQATKKQRFALWLASGKSQDFREMDITVEEATKMLKELNEKNGWSNSEHHEKKQTLEAEIKECLTNHSEEIVNSIKDCMGVKSIIQNDTNFMPDDGKRYLFLGFGCAFVWFEYDKRQKKMKKIEETFKEIVYRSNFLEDLVRKGLGAEICRQLDNCGNPFQSLLMQDEHVQRTYYEIVAEFAQSKGCRCWVNSRLD